MTSLLDRYEAAPDDVRRQVDRLLAQADDDRAWTERLGPAYRQADVAGLLGKSKQAVSADRGLLRLTMRSGEVGYPVFQFDGDRLLPGVRETVITLADAVATSWTTASWLTSPHPDLDDRTPLETLRAGDVERVVAAAAATALALAR